MNEQLWQRSALELGVLIGARDVSSREVVQAHLDRIGEVNDTVNAVTVVLADEALAAADRADAEVAAGNRRGPLHGVPFTIKENIDHVGSATTQGLPAMADAVPPLDAPTVERMLAAGAVPLARTNLPEMGLRITTDNPLRGATANPWAHGLTAGGSSGGEAVAIAVGMSPMGIGNDLGGSLRNPAYCCGITSIKATVGRVPEAHSLPPEDASIAFQLMTSEGPMARRVADVRAGLEVMAGWHPRDPRSVDAPLVGPEPAVRTVALVPEVPGVAVDATIADAVRRAGQALADAGWQVVEVVPPEVELVTELWAALLSADVSFMRPLLEPLMSPDAMRLLDAFEAMNQDAPAHPLVTAERARVQRAWSAFLIEHPLIVGPTWCLPPFEEGADVAEPIDPAVTIDRLRFITPGNLLGIPSVPVPTGLVDGLPTGVQVYAERWREDLCLDGAATIEAALGTLTPIDPVGG